MRTSRQSISEALAWPALAIFLALGVPVFICMPLWVDTTYHDLMPATFSGAGFITATSLKRICPVWSGSTRRFDR